MWLFDAGGDKSLRRWNCKHLALLLLVFEMEDFLQREPRSQDYLWTEKLLEKGISFVEGDTQKSQGKQVKRKIRQGPGGIPFFVLQ